MSHFDFEKKSLTLGVGELVRHGSPTAIRARAARPRLEAGVSEHRSWQRDAESAPGRQDFRAEVAITHTFDVEGYTVRLEGRVDGLHRAGKALVVEEVKTILVPPETCEPEELRRAVLAGEAYMDYRFQLEIYVFMLAEGGCEDASVSAPAAVSGRLIFRNLLATAAARELEVELEVEVDEIRERVCRRVREILDEYVGREERRLVLGRMAGELPLPFSRYRRHQDELAVAVSEALEAGDHLLLSAPPGIGKTAAVLHAALAHALPRGRRVFWVTAKTTQQRIVTQTVERIMEQWSARLRPEDTLQLAEAPLRTLILRARDKVCPNLAEGGVVFCDEGYCRFARDHASKLTRHRIFERLAEVPVLSPEVLADMSAAAEICPHELSLEVAATADLVIGDYNYVFDPGSALRRFSAKEIFGDAILVIDEAHNLYSRGRQYYSPSIRAATLAAFQQWAACQTGEDLEALMAFAESCTEFFSGIGSDADAATGDDQVFLVDIGREELEGLEREIRTIRAGRLLHGAGHGAGHDTEAPAEALARELRDFAAALELGDAGTPVVTLLDRRGRHEILRAVCLDPSRPLGDRIRAFGSAVAMSATLAPPEFFRDVLGFPAPRTRMAAFPSPFARANRKVVVDPGIATTYRRRSRDCGKVAALVDAVREQRRGNYLVFVPSYRYLHEIISHLESDRIGDDVIVQSRGMSEAERDRVLDLLREPDSARILYGVQGGIFSEGVDYPGGMAIGVFVVGLGLPRYCVEEELVRDHFEALFEKGFDYAYLYPGMHRVLQAAGRVIRGPEDEGVIVLLGERFADSRYSRLFPDDWYDRTPRDLVTDDVVGEVRRFWESR